jgi:Raf kinase inhibitor-like YbhB/YbcL family protein
MDDPDTARGVFTHWVLFDLPAETRSLQESLPKTERLDNGAVQGRNDAGRVGYQGPCPPAGNPHRYRFHLYALDATLGLAPSASKSDVLAAMQGHVLADFELVGLYSRGS